MSLRAYHPSVLLRDEQKDTSVGGAKEGSVCASRSVSSTRSTFRFLLCVATPYSSLTVGVPLELYPNEQRVALTPQNTSLLLKKGFGRVLVEKSAGVHAQFLDEQYREAGAVLVDRNEVYSSSDILLKVRPPILGQEVEQIKEGSTVISFLYPNQNKGIVDVLASKKASVFAMEMIPRISRAQVFDALRCVLSFAMSLLLYDNSFDSSMANIAGYKAVLEAANHFGRFLTGQVTAAG